MDDDLDTLAAEQGLDPVALRVALNDLRGRSGRDAFYIFWTAGGGSGRGVAGRERTLLAFPSPDAALTFAQRNRLTKPPDAPRLRRLSLAQLLRVMLREPAIGALHLVYDLEELPDYPAGQLPPGLILSREQLLRMLGARSA